MRVGSQFFSFEAFDREIARKLASLETSPGELAEELIARVQPPVRERVRSLWAVLAELPFDHVYPNYLTHPIRVAGSWLELRPQATYDELALALCHNVGEVGVAESVPLGRDQRRRIEALTIDRDRERDSGYLSAFYDRLDREGLIVLKALDKLDNALDWVRYEVDDHDVRVVLDHACPRAERVEPELAGYLRELTPYVVSDAAKARFAATA